MKPGSAGDRLGYRLWQTQHAVERAMEAALEPVGIGVTQVAALLHLKLQPGLSGAELARRLLIKPQSTATLLAALERQGWIRRAPHPVHRALVEAHLTEAGEKVLEAAQARLAEADATVSAGLGQRARADLLAALDTCLTNALTLISQAPPSRDRTR